VRTNRARGVGGPEAFSQKECLEKGQGKGVPVAPSGGAPWESTTRGTHSDKTHGHKSDQD